MRWLHIAALVGLFFTCNTVSLYLVFASQQQLNVLDIQPIWVAARWIAEGRGSPYPADMLRAIWSRRC